MKEMDREFRRPKNQWWLGLRDVVSAVSIEPDAPMRRKPSERSQSSSSAASSQASSSSAC